MSEYNSPERKNILVTGGAGFLGSHVCERLVSEHNVICVDNFASSDQDNISHLLTNPNFEFIKADICVPLDLESFPELDRFNIPTLGLQEIYHFACPTSPKQFDQYKIQTLEANSLGMKTVLDMAVKYRAKFLHASSSVVYGPRPNDGSLFKETDWGTVNPVSPRSCYDEGKRFSESIVATYRQVFDLDAKIVRIFRSYGPRLRLFDGQMIPDFIVDALENRPLTIYGEESFTTSLIYVDDVVDAILKMMNAPEAGPMNIGSNEDMLLTDVAQKIIHMTGSQSKIIFEAPLLFMTNLGLPDIELAKETLGWLPVTRLEEGLQKTIDYTKANKALIHKQYLLRKA
jgi:UDP-glucuronate decarboxylase